MKKNLTLCHYRYDHFQGLGFDLERGPYTFVVHSFHDTPVDISAVVHGTNGITDLSTGEVIKRTQETSEKIYGRQRFEASNCPVSILPHSFRAFKINR